MSFGENLNTSDNLLTVTKPLIKHNVTEMDSSKFVLTEKRISGSQLSSCVDTARKGLSRQLGPGFSTGPADQSGTWTTLSGTQL